VLFAASPLVAAFHKVTVLQDNDAAAFRGSSLPPVKVEQIKQWKAGIQALHNTPIFALATDSAATYLSYLAHEHKTARKKILKDLELLDAVSCLLYDLGRAYQVLGYSARGTLDDLFLGCISFPFSLLALTLLADSGKL
jgi:hypothetical protein